MDRKNVMDIIAYYLSEFDMRAFETLGFSTQTQGFNTIAPAFGKKPNYLRRLRDEYDVVTNSSRNGQRNRAHRQRILDTKEYLSVFSFSELTDMIQTFITSRSSSAYAEEDSLDSSDNSPLSETEMEALVNFRDRNATVRIRTDDRKIRVYNTSVLRQLKKLYGGCCQLCGEKPFLGQNTDICEAHHIAYFSESHNNDASNVHYNMSESSQPHT